MIIIVTPYLKMFKGFATLLLGFLLTTNLLNAQWEQRSAAPDNNNSLLVWNGLLWAAASSGVYASSDEGLTWRHADSGIPMDSFKRTNTNVLIEAGGALLVTAWNDTGAIYRSADSGRSWSRVLGGVFVRGIGSSRMGTYAFASDAIFKSTDNGSHWVLLPGKPAATMAFAVNDSFLYSSDIRGVLRSSDEGVTWEQTGLKNDFIVSLAISGGDLFAGSDFGGVYRSVDNGVHWTKGNTDSLFNISLLPTGSGIFDGTERGVFRSTDGGSTWFFTGLAATALNPIGAVGSMAASETHLFALTNGGTKLWAYPLLPLTVQANNGQPTGFNLEQNYPNPFNPSTEIRYSIPVGGDVEFAVFDLPGREVEVVTAPHQSAGTHTIRFEASRLSAGVYFYRVSSGKFSQTRRMVLVK